MKSRAPSRVQSASWMWRGLSTRTSATQFTSEAARRQGRSLVNWVAEVRVDKPRHIQDADWTREGARDFIAKFESFQLPDLDITRLMRETETVTEFPMVDRDPVGRWNDGRATLLGDAAHPMYPIGANGASQAIIDAETITASLKAEPGPGGLEHYESLRLGATAKLVLDNRASGPERVLDIAAARISGPDDRVEDLITTAELDAVASGYRATAGFTKRSER